MFRHSLFIRAGPAPLGLALPGAGLGAARGAQGGAGDPLVVHVVVGGAGLNRLRGGNLLALRLA